MIKGLTHDVETGVPNKITKFKGKISTGWQPNEGPNKRNAPLASGYFRVMKEVVSTIRLAGNKTQQVKKWVQNDEVQNELIKACNDSKTPRKIEFMCLHKTPAEMWEPYLGKFSQTEGLMCKSNGQGTIPIQLEYEGENRVRKPRLFDGKAECPYKECPDYKERVCKEVAHLKLFPLVDMSTNPYQLTTRSINTIMAISSALDDMYNLSRAAWKIQCQEQGKMLPFDGLFGVKMSLVHRKIKSGGREVYITQIEPSAEFSASVMAVVQRGIAKKQHAALTASDTSMVDVDMLADTTSSADDAPIAGALPDLSDDEQKNVATEFAADADSKDDKKEGDDELDKAAGQMLDEDKT